MKKRRTFENEEIMRFIEKIYEVYYEKIDFDLSEIMNELKK